MPQLESSSFATIEKNSLIQNGDGFIFLGLAAGAAFGTYLFTRGQGRQYSVLVAGIACVLLAIFSGTGGRLELQSLNSSGTNRFGIQRPQQTVKASAGIGIYAVGAGGALIALGGVMLAGLAVGGVEARPLKRTKTCPDCAETVLAEAKICKHCGCKF